MNVDILTDLDLRPWHFIMKKKPLVTLAVTDRKSSRHLITEQQASGWRNTNRKKF
jgi:hypothetical protein